MSCGRRQGAAAPLLRRPAAMMSPNFVFVLFALLATAGAYWITAARRGPLAGLGAALLALIFFVAIFAGLVALMRSGGVR